MPKEHNISKVVAFWDSLAHRKGHNENEIIECDICNKTYIHKESNKHRNAAHSKKNKNQVPSHIKPTTPEIKWFSLEMIHFNGDIFENCVPQLLLPNWL